MTAISKTICISVNERELATILASLRFHQDENLQGTADIPDQAIKGIATDNGLLKPLDFNEVGRLCERINVDEKPIDWKTCQHDWRDSSGPETGCGTEYWFRCSRCGAVKYRCVEQDGSYKDQIQPPEASSDVCIVSLPPLGLIIKAPPDDGSEEPLLRVVYVVDSPGADAYEAAEFTHQIMSDSNSLRPVLHIIDPAGNTTTVDMSENDVQE